MPYTSQPLEQAVALDPRFYNDPAIFQLEMGHLLPQHWQVVAPASAVANVGDVIVRDIANVPIIILRDESDHIRGFLNICAHRAGPLAQADGRVDKMLRCGYHGWTYNLEGNLINAPRMSQAKQFDLACVALTAIDVRVWCGMIFARVKPKIKGEDATEPEFEHVIDGLLEQMPSNMATNLIHHTRIEFDVHANWKIYVDNFLEGYHLPFVHPDLTRVVEVPQYKTKLRNWWSLQHSPVPADSGAYAAGEGFYFFLYPNTMLNFMPGRLQSNRVIPVDQERCRVEFDFYYTPQEVSRAPQDITFSEQVQEEDRLICEHVQKSIASGRYVAGRLSPEKEAGVWHWQERLRSEYQQYTGENANIV